MRPQFFDIHGHLNDNQFSTDREEVLERMRERGTWGIIVGTDYKSSCEGVALASQVPQGLYATIGVHPTDTQEDNFHESVFAELATNTCVVAVGECGLDYSCIADVEDKESEKERQRNLFRSQVDFAVEHNLPLMLHVRDCDKKSLRPGRESADSDAHREVLEILAEKKQVAGDTLRGDVHFFSQTIDIAREYFALGFTISFTGVITFSRDYDEVVREAPLDKIMSETDCPYVAPVPYRGKRNEPAFVEETVKKMAEIRMEDYETVRAALVENAIRTFNIKV